jgi:hypothetical protein
MAHEIAALRERAEKAEASLSEARASAVAWTQTATERQLKLYEAEARVKELEEQLARAGVKVGALELVLASACIGAETAEARVAELEGALRLQPCRCKCKTHGFGRGLEEATCHKVYSYKCSRCAALARKGGEDASLPDRCDYVAWVRWIGDEGHRRLAICDSDSKGAFKVYRYAVSPDPVVEKEAEHDPYFLD